MKVKVKNLGALKQAEFSIGELTIICGGNNTGKTYATYALFGFLKNWRNLFSIKIKQPKIDELLTTGVLHLDIQDYLDDADKIIAQGCQKYVSQLSNVFATSEDRFVNTSFSVSLDINKIRLFTKYKRNISASNSELFSITKSESSTKLLVTLLGEKEKVKIPLEMLEYFISNALKEIIFSQLLPRPFIVSVERTGAAIFRKELNFARNRLLEEISQPGKKINPMELLLRSHQDYALPVEENVDFIRELETVFKKRSFIADMHPEILKDFADIIGGEYSVNRNNELHYLPKGKRIKLSMDESSSAIRSLLHIGFYLRHEAQKGDLLIIDEPELNLHPENQRRVARLFARLINSGIQVFITTHSDYIVKELNTLIMLNRDLPHLVRLREEEGYHESELVDYQKVKVYIAEESSIKLDGKDRKQKCHTLIAANIDAEFGVEARSFDSVIDKMNKIQEEIVWGAD